MNRDKNGRFMKTDNKLKVGQRIKHSQLKEGMIIDFIACTMPEIPVNNAIVVKEGDTFYAVHDNPNAVGFGPVTKRFGKKFSWWLDFRWAGYDYKNMIFRGWYKSEEKPMYKVGDFVKLYNSKAEVICIHGNNMWVKHNPSGGYNTTTINGVSPWIEPVEPKYQVGDLVLTKGISITVEIMEISKDGVSYIGKDMFGGTDSFTEKDIIRKIGTVTKE
jgi:hypothetical protein